LRKLICFIIIGILVTGCATGNRKDTQALRSLLRLKDFKKAKELVDGKKFIDEENSKLLQLLERATVYHLNGHYYQSLKAFDEAKEVSDKLFTVSISKKIQSAVSNDNSDNYYGEKYERSMIRFYLSLNHFLLYMTGEYEEHSIKEYVVKKTNNKKKKEEKIAEVKVIPAKKLSAKERRFHLMGARSVLLEWNSLLDNYKSTTGGVVTYKDDLLAKVFGAFIHEQFRTRNDDRIALDLYKEAKNVLLKNFNILETYNEKAEKFKKDFDKLYKLPLKKVKDEYIKRTAYSKHLLTYLNEKIKELKRRKKDNVLILIEDDLITEKKETKINIPLPVATVSVVAGGKLSFSAFVGHMLSISTGRPLNIYFEVPEIPYEPIQNHYTVMVKDKSGKVVKEEKAAIVNPLGDLAHLTLDEKKSSIYAKTGARVATKHVAALVAAYAIYKSQAKKSEFFGLAAATLSYSAANAGIQASEKADLRFWSSLPFNYQISSMKLDQGDYDLFIKTGGIEKKLSSFKVQSSKSSVIIRERVINSQSTKSIKK
tara:strand:+ start:24868 stop:26487 length:1620 start_codon:yes stop_codon:yes gene_type:complete